MDRNCWGLCAARFRFDLASSVATIVRNLEAAREPARSVLHSPESPLVLPRGTYGIWASGAGRFTQPRRAARCKVAKPARRGAHTGARR